ncbi:hypothetical protein EDC01DRAFT_732373 [Geopyxis carbonaria]|nr:hypothetical protein EDC01DRAFT_732373 [Geopyxis carbonaria]
MLNRRSVLPENGVLRILFPQLAHNSRTCHPVSKAPGTTTAQALIVVKRIHQSDSKRLTTVMEGRQQEGDSESLVTDISIIGRWDSNYESSESMANVMLYAKITPQPSAKVPLLHLQALISDTTLIRVVPLLPDGSSHHSSPGIHALNIPTGGAIYDGSGSSNESCSELETKIWSPNIDIQNEHQDLIVFECDTDLSMISEDCSMSEKISLASNEATPAADAESHNNIYRRKDQIKRITGPARVTKRGRVYSCGSYSSVRELSPFRPDAIEQLKLDIPFYSAGIPDMRKFYRKVNDQELVECLKSLHPGSIGEQSDGSYDKPLNTDERLALAKRLFHFNDEIPAGKITMSIEGDQLQICFPEEIKDEAVVVEIHFKLKPLLLGSQKNYYTFVFSGFPYCLRGAFFDFSVIDQEDEWVFDTNVKDTASFEPLALHEANQIRGHISLNDTTPTLRSFVLRLKKIPSYTEIFDYKIRSKTNAMFSWSPEQKITGSYEINVAFEDVTPDPDFSRNLFNLILINGPDDPKEITITSASGNHDKFALESPVWKDGKEVKGAQLLQISRMAEDVKSPLTICFSTEGFAPVYFQIPIVEMGTLEDLIEQHIIIHRPHLPLNLVFAPEAEFWNDVDEEPDLPGSRKVTRRLDCEYLPTKQIEYPRVYVTALEPMDSVALEYLEKLLGNSDNVRFLEKLTYEFEEQSTSTRLPVRLRMSFETELSSRYGKELLRINSGGFQLDFVTIDGIPVRKRNMFLDNGDFVLLNYGQVGERSIFKINAFWIVTHGLTVNLVGEENYTEVILPQIINAIPTRVIFKYQKKDTDARIVSRTYSPSSGSWTVPFVNRKASMSGLQTFASKLHLQLPLTDEPPPAPAVDTARKSNNEPLPSPAEDTPRESNTEVVEKSNTEVVETERTKCIDDEAEHDDIFFEVPSLDGIIDGAADAPTFNVFSEQLLLKPANPYRINQPKVFYILFVVFMWIVVYLTISEDSKKTTDYLSIDDRLTVPEASLNNMDSSLFREREKWNDENISEDMNELAAEYMANLETLLAMDKLKQPEDVRIIGDANAGQRHTHDSHGTDLSVRSEPLLQRAFGNVYHAVKEWLHTVKSMLVWP